MNKIEADKMAQALLKQYGRTNFEVSLGSEADYKMVMASFDALHCPTGPNGKFFVLKVYPNGAPVAKG